MLKQVWDIYTGCACVLVHMRVGLYMCDVVFVASSLSHLYIILLHNCTLATTTGTLESVFN